MLGDIINAFVESLRKAPFTKESRLAVRAVPDDGRSIINTTLPCVAVSVMDSVHADVHIGGLIMDKVEVVFSVISNFNDQTAASFNEQQRKTLNLPMQIRNYIEKTKGGADFSELIAKYNFYPLYKGFRTYRTEAFHKDIATSVFVSELRYEVRIVDRTLHEELNPSATLEEATISDITDNRTDRTTKIS